jgi:hypothetical protein
MAKDVVVQCAEKCAEIGLTRFLLDGGPGMPELMKALLADTDRTEWVQLQGKFLSDVANLSSD